MGNPVSMILRREIEAAMASSLIKGFAEELGQEKAEEIATRVIESLAREAGRQTAEKFGGDTLHDLARVAREMWSQENALEIEFLNETDKELSFNVRRCRYAETYQAMGIGDLGFCLSCSRDAEFAKGFNPKIRMQRTQTIMQGAPYCDFRFILD